MCTAISNANSRRDVQRDVPISLQVFGVCAGRAVSLCSVRAFQDGLVLASPQYIRPRSVMEALISIPDDGEPLKVFLSVSYVQRSLRGYGVGVQFVGLSSAGQARWTRFVGLARGLYARQRAAQKMGGQTPQVVVCADAMSQRALLSLQEQRLDITHIRTPDELRTAVAQGRCEHIVLDLSSFDDHWAQALRQARCLIPSLQVWFLTSRDGEESLSKGLALEADVVVAKPCSHDILAMQLRSEQQSGYASVIPAQLIERVLHA